MPRPIQTIILDEIALEGLEGITISSLFVYIGANLKIDLPLAANLQQDVWSFILLNESQFVFYELPVERATIKIYNRFENVDPDLEVPITPDVCPMQRFKCVPVHDGETIGSCELYKERTKIPIEELRNLSLETVFKTWGNKLIIVGSQELRFNALIPVNVPLPTDLTPLQYCLLEAIGRSRYNGETTAGNWSLTQYGKDSTIVFYIKNKLLRSGVIMSQPFNEKRKDRLVTSTLLTLPRFYSNNKSMLTAVIEKLFMVLKESPKKTISFVEASSYFPSLDRQKSFKKITVTHLFRRVFETVTVPYYELHNKTPPKSNSELKGGRTVLLLQLRNPNMSIEELFGSDETNEKEENDDPYYNEKHSYVDMPLRDEFYRGVLGFGSRGCSHTELCHFLSLPHLTVRQLFKTLLAEDLLTSYITDVGRQRITMYVAAEFAESVQKDNSVSLSTLKNLQCSTVPTIPDIVPNFNDIAAVSVRLKPFEYTDMINQKTSTTSRQIVRKKIVVKTIDEKCIVQVVDLRRAIQISEKEQGFKDEVCRKSLRRLLHSLQIENIVKLYEITLKFGEQIRIFRYVAHPQIDIDHEVLKHEILKLKNVFFLTMEERRLRAEASAKEQLKKASKKHAKTEKVDKKPKSLSDINVHKPPKFILSRYFHEFLFYIVVELNEQQPDPIDITEDLMQQWTQTDRAFNTDPKECFEYLVEQHLKAYTYDINWRTFISPLPKYPEKPDGWAFVKDAIDRMPLSIFNKMYRIEKGADERLLSYLEHPVLKHVLLQKLPLDLQCEINQIKLQKIYTAILKLLNNMGLVQVTEREHAKDPLMMWVYLNRRTQMLDTTSSEASYAKINAKREYPIITYEFLKYDDIYQYWSKLHKICVYTKLGFKRNAVSESVKKNKELQYVKYVTFDEAPLLDNGMVPGDRLGAAGLPSRLQAHAFRNWSWAMHTKIQAKPPRTGRTAQVSIRNKNVRQVPNTRKSHIRRLQPGAVCKRVSSKTKTTGARDAIDRDALKNMRTLRVTWFKEEDNVLKMARAVYLYVAAPVATLGLLAVGRICRDLMRYSIGSNNKTSQACVRRITFLIKMQRHVPEVPTWLHMLQTNQEINRKYGDNFLEKLKLIYPNRADYENALTIHFILITSQLYELIHSSICTSVNHFTIPDHCSEFNEKFCVRVPVTQSGKLDYSNPTTEEKIQIMVLISVLHSSLCCVRDKTLYNAQAFEIYKNFSEEVLQAAFMKARRESLVVPIKRKQYQMLPTLLSGPAYFLSSKYRLRLLFLKIPYVVYDAFYAFYQTALSKFFRACPTGNEKSTLELKSPNAGQLIFLAEGIARNFWKINIKLPKNILTVDAEQKQTCSQTDRILHHYHAIFDNAPQTEYTKNLESEPSKKQLRVKFHPANLRYKLNYMPFDFISKLPTRYLHFFCAMDHLQEEVDINFSKLCRQDDEDKSLLVIECPFRCCIMKSSNYINAIERIVREKQSLLGEFGEMAPQKLLNLANSGCCVKVQPSNLLTLVRMLESFWTEKESTSERKDLGKVRLSLKTKKPIDWRVLCKDILEFNPNEDKHDKSDEYEPTLNKEEPFVRAQDVFVVNLPTLQISESGQHSKAKRREDRNGTAEIPVSLLDVENQRETVLQRLLSESTWKYTEHTFDSLKPRLHDLHFSATECQELESIHDFIEMHQFGVTVIDLMHKFECRNFLLRALQTLTEHCLIKRVGIASFLYVHKSHIRAWLVNTFHIKRLDRENQSSSVFALKRKHTNGVEIASDTAGEVEEGVDSKKAKLLKIAEKPNPVETVGKRVPIPIKRFEDIDQPSSSSKTNAPREAIVMKPFPWIRLNGSLNRRVLDRYLGSILIECISRTGCRIVEICQRFAYLYPVDVMLLLEILSELKCLHLTEIQSNEVHLLTEYENITETIVQEIIDPKNTYVTAHEDAIMRMANFIGEKKYKAEFV